MPQWCLKIKTWCVLCKTNPVIETLTQRVKLYSPSLYVSSYVLQQQTENEISLDTKCTESNMTVVS
jgi:hypothetical protein